MDANSLESNLEQCIEELRAGTLTESRLRGISDSRLLKQDLLYVQSRSTALDYEIHGFKIVEDGVISDGSRNPDEWPYQTVHEAIVDGWQVVQFPHLQAPFDDTDLDVVGYEFILQKLEVVDE